MKKQTHNIIIEVMGSLVLLVRQANVRVINLKSCHDKFIVSKVP